ncbi:MAG TPA: ResA-like WAxxUGC motif-containing protein [Acidimicrobiia bacterium]|nr:ResA-like WAxxUGC motif-containing protein [Acidimicrobiia bacterium]
MILHDLTVEAHDFESRTGWAIKPEGACKGEVCVPLPSEVRLDGGLLDVAALAPRLGMPLVADLAHGIWALGPETATTGRVLTSAVAPELDLPDADGTTFKLSSLRGQKVVLVSWASWCGCRFDLPLWQELRERWKPLGVEVVTVALDVEANDARPFIEKAQPEHPSLIDEAHVSDELFGFVNVPNGVWIDEDGTIVRPAEPAHPGRNPATESFRKIDVSTVPPDVAEMLVEARKIRSDPNIYVEMVDDWIAHDRDSRYALAPDEVVRRSDPRTHAEATAAAEFELGQHLHRAGDHAAAIPHWREAHRLYPANWTYKRQAWNFEDPLRQGPTDAYESSWFEDLKKIGAENYYPEIVP